MLVDLGAELVDADAIVKELQEPGQPVFVSMVDHFGDRIVGDDGALDRAAVADIVFNDADELTALNGIVHPKVFEVVMERLEALAETDAIVIQDIPLLAESGRTGFSGVVVVDCPPEVAVERLVTHRDFSEEDARARIANQADRDERLAIADKVVDNGGELVALEPQIAEVWAWMQTLEPAEDLKPKEADNPESDKPETDKT